MCSREDSHHDVSGTPINIVRMPHATPDKLLAKREKQQQVEEEKARKNVQRENKRLNVTVLEYPHSIFAETATTDY